MRIRVDADVAPVVMQEAMICMMQALDKRPLNALEKLGWLVVCQHIVDRWPKGNENAIHNQHDLPNA